MSRGAVTSAAMLYLDVKDKSKSSHKSSQANIKSSGFQKIWHSMIKSKMRHFSFKSLVPQHFIPSQVSSPRLCGVWLSSPIQVSKLYLAGKLTYVDHLLQTLGTNSVQTAQQFGFPAASIIAVVADFTLKFFQSVNQRLSPGLHLNTPQQRVRNTEHTTTKCKLHWMYHNKGLITGKWSSNFQTLFKIS